MATRKKVKTKEPVVEMMSEVKEVPVKKESRPYLVLIVAAVVALGFYLYKTNSFPVSAIVGYKPIFRSQVNKELYKQYGKSMVESLVTETLIKDALKKEKVEITKDEIDGKVEEIKASLGEGQDLETLLAQRGMSMKDIEDQLYLQMGIEKLLTSKISVTEEEVADFIEQNGDYLTATTEAGQKDEAMLTLKTQKTQSEISAWVIELKEKARVWYADGENGLTK